MTSGENQTSHYPTQRCEGSLERPGRPHLSSTGLRRELQKSQRTKSKQQMSPTEDRKEWAGSQDVLAEV